MRPSEDLARLREIRTLEGCGLRQADRMRAHPRRAGESLSRSAPLLDANLELEHADSLIRKQFEAACGNAGTKLPDGLTGCPSR